ncbi:MAG: hypothetical protein HOP29_02270 [Phycisphaerales bacterium]|nr:hypothetical protein [Phycisphaerales bacterium]
MTAVAMVHTTQSQSGQSRQSRLAFHAAWGLSVAVFSTIGWMALGPDDPLGAVSLLSRRDVWVAAAQAASLATVVSAIGAALAGRMAADVGAFAVCIGLTIMSFQGSNMTQVLMERGGTPTVCLLLAAESLFWCLIAVWCLFVSGMVVRWLGLTESAVSPAPGCDPEDLDDRVARRREVGHVIIVAALTLVLVRVFMAGSGDRAIRHGQACFAVGAAFYLAVGRAQAFVPVRSAIWSWSAVPIVCIAAFVMSWAASSPTVLDNGLVTVPRSAFLRILPITYAAAGTAAVLLARWRTVPHSDG